MSGSLGAFPGSMQRKRDVLKWHVDRDATLFPFYLCTNQVLGNSTVAEMRQFCLDTFGPGGFLPTADKRWHFWTERNWFSFREESDRDLFYIAFQGIDEWWK